MPSSKSFQSPGQSSPELGDLEADILDKWNHILEWKGAENIGMMYMKVTLILMGVRLRLPER